MPKSEFPLTLAMRYDFSPGLAHWVPGVTLDSLRRSLRALPLPEALLKLSSELLRQADSNRCQEPQASLQPREGEQDHQSAQDGFGNDEQV